MVVHLPNWAQNEALAQFADIIGKSWLTLCGNRPSTFICLFLPNTDFLTRAVNVTSQLYCSPHYLRVVMRLAGGYRQSIFILRSLNDEKLARRTIDLGSRQLRLTVPRRRFQGWSDYAVKTMRREEYWARVGCSARWSGNTSSLPPIGGRDDYV